jgi:16S rRNA processing protein RimM
VAPAAPPEGSPAPSERVTLARILRPRGIRGEVAAEILTDFPERLTKLREVWLWDGRGQPRPARLRECWLHRKQVIFLFEGCDSINDAEPLRGLEVQVPFADRMALPADRHYVADLAGCEVWEGAEKLGTVREVQFTGAYAPGTSLLVVQTPRGDMLVPLAEEICTRIDTAARRIEVRLPEGLRDLNIG